MNYFTSNAPAQTYPISHQSTATNAPFRPPAYIGGITPFRSNPMNGNRTMPSFQSLCFRMGRRLFATALAATLLWIAGCTRPSVPIAPVEAPATPVESRHGMVVSAKIKASEAGVEVLRQGGNAVDAAVATGFALAVTYPPAGNLGGGGFMVIRFADGDKVGESGSGAGHGGGEAGQSPTPAVTTIDYREKAPAAAHRDMYLDNEGQAIPQLSRLGYLASGVPGSPAGLVMAHEKYGRLSLAEVMAPAIRLAEEGFVLSRRDAGGLNAQRDVFAQFESTAKYFTKSAPDQRYEAGERFVQQDLAEVLRRIRDRGWAGFYEGETAELIAAEMARGGGWITMEDLAAYEAVERAPLSGTYRSYRFFAMAPPSSGGVALAQLLNAVEPYNMADMGHHTASAAHLMGEAMRRVYADRAQWLGDPDYFAVPAAALIRKEYMQQRMAGFDPDRADSSAAVAYGDPLAFESSETTHYSVVDADGQAVSVTTTINGSYGSKVVIDGAGFFMNNEMDDFSAKPGAPNMFGLLGSEANAIEPGKRMLSSMTPTIVEDPSGELFMVIGSPGGGRIITTVFEVMLNVIDHEMNIQEAVAAPRIHHQWLPDVLFYEAQALSEDTRHGLERRGWTLNNNGAWGRADGIVVRRDAEGVLYRGGADPRGDDAAAGY